jgi:hypothetical protein
MAIVTNQEHWRIRTDATAAQGGTPVWAALQDTNPTTWSVTTLTAFRIRFLIANTGTTSTGSSAFQIYCARNGGAAAAVTTSGTFVKSADGSGGFSTDGSAISTGLLTAVGTFAAGQYDDTGAIAAQTILASGCTEMEFGLQFTSSTLLHDTYVFTVRIGGVALSANSAPTLTMTITTGPLNAATNLASAAAGLGTPALGQVLIAAQSLPLAPDGSAQGTSLGATSSCTVTLTTTNPNDIIIVASAYNGPTGTVVSTVTGGGLTFVARSTTFYTLGENIEEWWAVAPTPLSAVTFTVTFNQSTSGAPDGAYAVASAFALSGANTSSLFDTHSGLPIQTSGHTGTDPVSVSTSASNTFIWGMFRSGGPVGSGFTQIINANGVFIEYAVATSPQTGFSVTIGAGGTGASASSLVDAIVAHSLAGLGQPVLTTISAVALTATNLASGAAGFANSKPILGATYFVNSSTGLDSNNGRTPGAAWQTAAHVNAASFSPGDVISFNGGQTFTGPLVPPSSGAAGAKITFMSYGAGRATISSAANIRGVFIQNLSNIIVRDFIIVGSSADPASNTGHGFRAQTTMTDATKFDGISLINCDISLFATGVTIANSATADTGTSGFTNFLCDQCNVHNNGNGFQTFSNSTLGGPRDHSNITVSNFIFTSNAAIGTTSGTGSITFGAVSGGLITNGQASLYGAATSSNGVGIWLYDSDNVTIQFCESHHNSTASGFDGGGFDIDQGCTGCIIQYCYSHDNQGPGYLMDTGTLTSTPFTNNTVRYCLSENDAALTSSVGSITVANDAPETMTGIAIYNNTIYTNKGSSNSAMTIASNASAATGHVANNIFYTTAGAALALSGGTSALTFTGNDYFATGAFAISWNGTAYTTFASWQTATSQEKISGSNVGLTSNPLLVNPGGGGTTGGYLPPNPTAYELKVGSPMIATGLNLNTQFSISAGSQDFYGIAIPNGSSLFPVGSYGGTGVVAMTATNLASAADGLGQPVYGNVFIAANLASAAAGFANSKPVYGNVLTATNLAAGAAGLGTPLLATIYPFTATTLAVAAAGLGQPLLATKYTFSATNLASAAAAIGTPTFNQIDALAALSLASGAAGIGTPLLTTVYLFAATNLAVNGAGLGQPVMAQVNILTATNMSVSAAGIGTAALATVYPFSATTLSSGAVGIGTPLLTTVYLFAATNLAAGSAGLGQPSINQGDVLSAVTLATTADALGHPVYGNVFTATALASGAAGIGSPLLATVYPFTATTLASGAAGLGQPVIAQVNILAAPTLAAGAAGIGTAVFNQIDALTTTFASAAAGIGSPLLTTIYTFTATTLAAGAAGLGQPVAHQANVLTATNLSVGADGLGQPTFNQGDVLTTAFAAGSAGIGVSSLMTVYSFTATNLASGAAGIGQPVAHQANVLGFVNLAAASAGLGQPVLNQGDILASMNLTAGAAGLGIPLCSETYVLGTPSELASGLAGIGKPVIAISNTLSVPSLAAGAAGIGSPACATKYSFAATNLATSTAGLGQPAATGTSSLTASTLACGVAHFDQPLLHPTSLFTAASLSSSAVSLGMPALIANSALSGVSLASGAASIGKPVYATLGQLIPVSIASAAFHADQPALFAVFPLLAQTLGSGRASIIVPSLQEFVVDHHSLYRTMKRLEMVGRMSLANAESHPRQPPNVNWNNWKLPPP